MRPGHGLAIPSRRRFVQGAALGGALAGLGLRPSGALARTDVPSLGGTVFDLTIGETPVDFTGRVRAATAVNGSVPAPTLRWKEGTTVTLRVTKRLAVPNSMHWHGIVLPDASRAPRTNRFAGSRPWQGSASGSDGALCPMSR